ncbi:EcsC protein family protein [compost metagenome]
MNVYEQRILADLQSWKLEIRKKPSVISKLTAGVQHKINSYIPKKIHEVLTSTIKQMVKVVLYGSTYSTSYLPDVHLSLLHREALAKVKIENYGKTGAAEGGITGAGGFLMSLADFPALIALKLKLLFEIATLYGYDVKDYRERIFILHIFQLAFSGKKSAQFILTEMEHWESKRAALPEDADHFDWHTFQQEYRDYIDLAKLAQLLPVVGAAVGAIANYQLIKRLGKTAMMAYRIRGLQNKQIVFD